MRLISADLLTVRPRPLGLGLGVPRMREMGPRDWLLLVAGGGELVGRAAGALDLDSAALATSVSVPASASVVVRWTPERGLTMPRVEVLSRSNTDCRISELKV